MRQKETLQSLTDFHQARLTALDHSELVRSLMRESPYPLTELMSTLKVTELGAYSIIAMFRCDNVPDRGKVENHLNEIEHIRAIIIEHVSRYLLSAAEQSI